MFLVMIPNIRDPAYLGALIFFHRAARHLSFAKAAEDLGVTASAVSHRIAALESALEKRLFERGVRAIRLTRDGAELASTTERVFADLEAVTETLSERKVLRVAVGPYLSTVWLMPRLADFERSEPGVRVDLVHAIGLVDPRGVDVSVVWWDEHPTDAEARPLFETLYIPVIAPERVAGHKEWGAGLPLVHYRDRNQWRHWLVEAGMDPALAETGDVIQDPILHLETARHGRGLAIGTLPFVVEQIAAGRLAPAHPSAIPSERSIWVAVSAPRDRLASRFRDWLFDAAARSYQE
jgi:LysR family glycine cleavage system transcriptional activator